MLHEHDTDQTLGREPARRRQVPANKLRYRKRTRAERNRLRPAKGGIYQRRFKRPS